MDNVFKILNIENLNSFEDAHNLINMLTNHNSPTREAVAYKLVDLVEENIDYFLDEFSLNKILDAIIDINPNVTRSICLVLEKNSKLQNLLEQRIIERTQDLLNSFDFDIQKPNTTMVKSHAKNKKEFALYWYLEALSICQSVKNEKNLLKILKKTINFSNYTIREKTAKILAKMEHIDIELLQKAKQDDNFYVKMQVYDKMI